MRQFALSVCVALFLSCSATDGNTEGGAGGTAAKPSQAKAFPVLWEVSRGLESPESVYLDADSGFLFVSQVGGGGPTGKDGDGRIAKLSSDGKPIDSKWITGLNAPKGLRSHGGRLWVSDIDRIVGIDIAKGEIAQTVEVAGAQFLNDVACDADGAVYVSDMTTNKIHRYKDGKLSVFAEGDQLENPNGLLVDGNRLVVAAWGSGDTPGRLFWLDLKTAAKTLITQQPAGNLDGLEADGKGGYIVTDWMEGKVMRIAGDGKKNTILKLKQGTADLAYLADKGILIVPRMSESKVTAFDLSKLDD